MKKDPRMTPHTSRGGQQPRLLQHRARDTHVRDARNSLLSPQPGGSLAHIPHHCCCALLSAGSSDQPVFTPTEVLRFDLLPRGKQTNEAVHSKMNLEAEYTEQATSPDSFPGGKPQKPVCSRTVKGYGWETDENSAARASSIC